MSPLKHLNRSVIWGAGKRAGFQLMLRGSGVGGRQLGPPGRVTVSLLEGRRPRLGGAEGLVFTKHP